MQCRKSDHVRNKNKFVWYIYCQKVGKLNFRYGTTTMFVNQCYLEYGKNYGHDGVDHRLLIVLLNFIVSVDYPFSIMKSQKCMQE